MFYLGLLIYCAMNYLQRVPVLGDVAAFNRKQ